VRPGARHHRAPTSGDGPRGRGGAVRAVGDQEIAFRGVTALCTQPYAARDVSGPRWVCKCDTKGHKYKRNRKHDPKYPFHVLAPPLPNATPRLEHAQDPPPGTDG